MCYELTHHLDKAYKQMERFLKDGKPIDPDIRKTIRQISDFLSQAAQIDYDLALHCHENGGGNTACRFHARTKSKEIYDGNKLSPYVNNGAPFPPRLGKAGKPGIAQPGCMNCGCDIAEVLLEFYFFKTWTIISLRPNLAGCEEGWGGTYLNPRQRAFLVQAMQKYAGITINNIYSGDVNGPTADHSRQLIVSQIEHLISNLNAISPAITYSLHSEMGQVDQKTSAEADKSESDSDVDMAPAQSSDGESSSESEDEAPQGGSDDDESGSGSD